MNVPVPPVFIYETDFNRYQVMDGLQRITAIIDFYNDCYELKELTQWSELNGRKYSQLPQKVKEGIDRRQLSVITLLKESSNTLIQEEEMKKMVFERLNTGGVTLEDQEIRNALYNGPFNDLCILLSGNNAFRKLWFINPDDIDGVNAELDNYDDALKYAKNKLYKSNSIKNLKAFKEYESNYNYIPAELKNYFDGEISILIVDEDYRGKKIGKKLLLDVFELAKKDNMKNLQIVTDESCNYKFYEKLGCQKVYETIIKNREIGQLGNGCTEKAFIYEKKL